MLTLKHNFRPFFSIITNDESDDPLFEISAAFYDGAGIEQTSATVGDTIFYVIKGPGKCYLKLWA